jgi:hypothetical protein
MKVLALRVDLDLMTVIQEFADDHPKLKNSFVSQDQCRIISQEFIDYAQSRGYEAEMWSLTGPSVVFTETPARWRNLPQEKWKHHVAKIGSLWVDFTARQFGSNQPFPKVYRSRRDLQAEWDTIRRER